MIATGRIEQTYNDLEKRFGPVGRTLSRLIRPAFVAPMGKTFVWVDFAAIEARVLPWLAATGSAERVLDVFRENDLDPSLPDVYKVQAGQILGKSPHDVTKAERQSHGKVPILALGFGGGNGALFAMARAYGASFTEDEATSIVKMWRDTNPWARKFWDDLWEASLWCMENPGEARAVGRVTFYYDRGYIGGTLFMVLPDGTWLSYPAIRWEERERKDKMTGETTVRNQLTYRRGRVRAALWYGILAENATQAVAACLLRHVMVVVDRDGVTDIVGHTHDEVITMPSESRAQEVADYLCDVMRTPPEWADGLPLAVEATIETYYTKVHG